MRWPGNRENDSLTAWRFAAVVMTRLSDPDDLLLESSGAPVSEWDEIAVIDGLNRPVPEGEPGELITRGPYTIRGYYNAPDVNAQAFTDDGFYRMGDIVRKRARYVYTEGRCKDLINRGGEKISCDEVENLIFKLPQVREVSLVAMPDPVFGERACACVVLQAGAALTFKDLLAHLRAQQIASFKLPERLEIMESSTGSASTHPSRTAGFRRWSAASTFRCPPPCSDAALRMRSSRLVRQPARRHLRG